MILLLDRLMKKASKKCW